MRKKIFFENLDGLRFLCFLSVFLFHSFYSDFEYITTSNVYHFIKRDLLGNGNLGVNCFFVLSGFLITFLLIEEKKLNGNISLKNFWIRRILRIWPLFYCCILYGFYIFPIVKSFIGESFKETASIQYYLIFLNNFDLINKGGIANAPSLVVLWSIAVEEQFYLFWPIMLYFLPIKKYWIAFVIIILGSLFFRAFYQSGLFYEYHTFSCIGDMGVGAFGAWLVAEKSSFRNRISNLSKPNLFFLYGVFILCFFYRGLLNMTFVTSVFERVFIAIIFLLIILEQSFCKNSLFKFSQFKIISKLGKISYGLYCLHFIAISITTNITKRLGLNKHFWEVFILETVIALILTIIISTISYKILEKPFLKLKDKFSYITK